VSERHDRWYQERADAGWWRSKDEIAAQRDELTADQAAHARLQARRESALHALIVLGCALTLLAVMLGVVLWLSS